MSYVDIPIRSTDDANTHADVNQLMENINIVNDTAESGWMQANETWTYASADDPTYTFTISGDKTGKYSVGMKIKLTQTTVKYFIVTLAPSYNSGTGLTTITVYGGTDYDLESATVTEPYYSMVKSPYGFPLDPLKWTTSFISDISNHVKNNPVNDTWYGGTNAWTEGTTLSGYIHPGLWTVNAGGIGSASKSATAFIILLTLTTDPNGQGLTNSYNGYSSMGLVFMSIKDTVNLTTKTQYYLLMKSYINSITTMSCAYIGAQFTCAYL